MKKKTHLASAMASLGLAALTASPAAAFERGTSGFSITPGTFLNAPATTPPPGLYGTFITSVADLKVTGPGAPGSAANGNQPQRVYVAAPVQVLTYVPGFQLFGADYSLSFGQQENINAQATGGTASKADLGFHNSSVTPIILGWKLGDSGFFVKTALSIVIPDGTITGTNGVANAGVPYTTIRPLLGIQYISHGWSFVDNIVAEYNTTNPISGYHSGTTLRSEGSITRTFGRLTVGPSLGWIGQIQSDRSSQFYNYVVNTGHYSVVGVGGYIGYNFGPVSVSVFGLQDVLTYASGGTPSTAAATRGRDTAFAIGGQTINFAVNFKIPGIAGITKPVDFASLHDAAQ